MMLNSRPYLLAILAAAACAAADWCPAQPAAPAPAKPPPNQRSAERAAPAPLRSTDDEPVRIGPAADHRIVVPTNQVLSPLGRQVILDGRPTDVALSPDDRRLAVLADKAVYLIDPASGKVLDHAAHPGGSFCGIVFTDGRTLLASSFQSRIGPGRSSPTAASSRSRRFPCRAPTRPSARAASSSSAAGGSAAVARPDWQWTRLASISGRCSTCATRWSRSTWPRAALCGKSA